MVSFTDTCKYCSNVLQVIIMNMLEIFATGCKAKTKP